MPKGKFSKIRPELFIPDDGTTLLHRVDAALKGRPHLLGRHLVIETREGVVTVRGIVDSYFTKQMAQEALRAVQGILELRNQLEVAALHLS